MSRGTEHLETCEEDNCELCSHYLEFCMACDHCGHWGQQDADGWEIGVSYMVYCSEACCHKAGDELLKEEVPV